MKECWRLKRVKERKGGGEWATGNGKQTRQGVGEVGDRVWEIHRADREIKTGTGRQQIQRVGDRGDKE